MVTADTQALPVDTKNRWGAVQVWALGTGVLLLSTIALGYWSTRRNALYEAIILVALAGALAFLSRRSEGVALSRSVVTGIGAAVIASYAVVLFLAQAYLVGRSVRLEPDTALFQQSLWWTLHGVPFFDTFVGTSQLGFHASFLLVVLLPLYALWPSPLALLLVQDIALAVGGWVLFSIARRYVDDVTSVCLLSIYLLFPAYQYFFGSFYEASLAPPLMLLAIDAALCRRWIPFVIWAVLLMSVKETFAVTVVLLGLYLLVIRRERVGVAVAALGAAWLLAMVAMVMPWFRSTYFAFPSNAAGYKQVADIWAYHRLGTSIGEIFHTVLFNPGLTVATISQPEKLRYLVLLAAPYLVIGLFGSALWLLALPDLATTLLVDRPWTSQFVGGRFAMIIAVSFALSALFTLTRIVSLQIRQMAAVAMLLATAGLLPYWFNSTWLQTTPPPGTPALRSLVREVGASAPVAAPDRAVEWLANRPIIFDYEYGTPPSVISRCSAYVILDSTAAAHRVGTAIERAGFHRARVAPPFSLWRAPLPPHCSVHHLPWT